MPPFPRPGKTLLDELRERPGLLGRFALIGTILATVFLAFCYVGGWFSPARISGDTVVDALQTHNGNFPSFRRAHSKGMCFVGHFDSNGQGQSLSQAAVFKPGQVPLFGRFSLGVPAPYAPDGVNVFHAIALNFTAPNGEVWRTAMDNTPIFPVNTVDAFVAFQRATSPDPATGKPDKDKVAAYMAKHKETKAFVAWLNSHPIASSFANGSYYSINAFRFINALGENRAVRWSLVPEAPFSALDPAQLPALNQANKNFLFDEMIQRLGQGPQRWHLMITVAQPGDPTNSATQAWPEDRHQLDVGTLVIDKALTEEDGPCRDVTFDPTVLPKGIAVSDDPLLAARSAAYSVSLTRRSGEAPQPSALANDPAAERARR
jgi:catalase